MTFFSKEAKLVKQLRTGDTEAFRTLYDKYFAPLYKFIYYQTYSKELSEDLIQEVFCRVWEKREQLDPKNSFQAFVYKIAQHLVIDHYRKNASRKGHLATLSAQSLIEHPPPVELDQTIQNALNSLHFNIRTTFLMSRYQNMSYDEIAAALNISKKTVEFRISQALLSIRSALKDEP